ncbi:hypothetical protein GCM10010495_66070 [Kitasatospora herbaricolor]|uniref:hypothetical protein n=1 Tax=Kitasatospora herbaricolor TaxID=68217 RepID=UPI001748C9D9|nr:hypothetical protein [Kitasatospora herbaricolor]MDQ0307961.1 hypothetical protein [Kitasatospora herbaricolor]GGV39499.1 hypothetical protein GCM10010495_66070 [Kitasatospora herbaricolor]
MSITELRPTGRTRAASKPAGKEAAEAEALRAKTATAKAAADIANQLKAAKAAAEIAAGEAQAQEVREAAADKRREAERQRTEAAAARQKAERSAAQWRTYAKTIAVICVVVSLPLQMMAFWSPKAWFLLAAPLVLEGLAWALLKGAEAAIDDHRPSWHYRALAGAVALFAATVNFLHGSSAFGLGTGLGGAFCSLAGPLVWDLHEHGRIRKRDGKVSRRRRRAEARQVAAEAAEQLAAEQKAADDREAVEISRSVQWPQAWERAVALAAAVGELHPSETTWKRAWDDTAGAPLGDTAESIAARVAAKAATKEAAKDQTNPVEKVEKPQVESQVTAPRGTSANKRPDGRRNNGGTPPRQKAGSYPKYSPIARRAMSLAAKKQQPARTAS